MPEIFVQISDPANPENYKVITGLCILVRSPAFHPFDSLLIYLTVAEGT
jgi:RNA-dependent RNA polymerase